MRDLLSELTIEEAMVAEVRELRDEGYAVALVTNNVREGSAGWRALLPVDELFSVVIDSSEVGMRKPDPRIYLLALERLGGIAPERAIFLDDAPGNVDGARKAGLTAIHVTDAVAAIVELNALLGR
jgi:putative hydrolase of the HAD superfamily